MERLTIPDEKIDERTTRMTVVDVAAVRDHAMEFYWHLKAYEDTGLTPEQCAEYAKADREGRYIVLRDAEQDGVKRLRELAEADKEGRVAVLPCKVGDTVYKVITIQAQKPVMLETQVKTLGQAADVSSLIGKKNKVINIFLTREQAEAALKEAQNG